MHAAERLYSVLHTVVQTPAIRLDLQTFCKAHLVLAGWATALIAALAAGIVLLAVGFGVMAWRNRGVGRQKFSRQVLLVVCIAYIAISAIPTA